MGVLDWLYGKTSKEVGEAKTGGVEKAAMQISERKRRMKQAECARQAKEFDSVTGKCV